MGHRPTTSGCTTAGSLSSCGWNLYFELTNSKESVTREALSPSVHVQQYDAVLLQWSEHTHLLWVRLI